MGEDEGRIIRAFAGGRTVRVLVAEMRHAAERTRTTHGLGRDAARLAAEGVVATALLSGHIKGDERLTLHLQAEQPRFSFIGDLGADGVFRARLTPSDVRSAEGGRIRGVMIAIKSDGRHEVYRGHTAITDEPLDRALAAHLVQSTQVSGVLRMAVAQDDDDRVTFAAGYLVERLPEHPTHPWISLEAFGERYGALAELPPEDVLTGMAFGRIAGSELEILEVRPVRWACRCSQEKVEATLGSLGPQTLEELIGDGRAEVSCDFCGTTYVVELPRLQELRGIYGAT